MEGTRKLVLDKFEEHLKEFYGCWCEKHGINESNGHMVTFLIDQDLIPATKIQRFTILREFDRLKKKNPFYQKTQTVNLLAHRFNISERTVWSILKHGDANGKKQ